MTRTVHRSRRFVCTLLTFALVFGVSGIQPAYAASTLETSLDTEFTVTTGGNADWFAVNSAFSLDGVDHAQSGYIGHSQSTWFEITVTGPGELTWYSGVSSELGCDFLRVSDNGVDQSSLAKSGIWDWTWALYDVPAGTHTIRWTYVKDGSINGAADIAFVDDISFANTAPVGRVDGAHLADNEVQLLPSAPGAGDQAGQAVAICDDTMASGAPWDDTGVGADAGSVSIYRRTGGTWETYQLLTANDEIVSGHFGSVVALDQDFLIVGNPTREKVYPYIDNGLAYVPWGAPLESPVPSIGFGGAVAQSGTTLVVGCRAYNGYVGRVYVYVYNFGWSLQQVIDPPDGAASDQFGTDVAIDGDRLIVGAPEHQHPGAPGGAAYVYERSGATWTLSSELNAPSASATDEFGSSVGISGSTAVVGAPRFDDGVAGDPDYGAAYVYMLDGTWSQTDFLEPPTHQSPSMFGYAVAIDGDTILSGASNYDGATSGGAVFAYARANGIFFDQVEIIHAAAPQTYMSFGASVDIDGPQFVTGARNYDGPAGGSQGSAYAYDGAYYHVMAGGTLSVPATMGVVVNDLDAEQDTLEVGTFTEPAHGTLVVYNNGSFMFAADDPAPAEIPLDYCPSDSRLAGDWTNSFITVAPAPSGDPVFNWGDYYTNSTTVNIGAAIANVKMYRTRIDTDPYSPWSWMWGDNVALSLGAVAQGEHSIDFQVKGSGGNRSFNDNVFVDTVKPLVARDPFAMLSPGDSVHVTATDTDGSGIDRIGYTIEGGTAVYVDAVSANIPFPSAGEFDVEYWAEDNAGNSSTVAEETFTVIQPEATYSRFSGSDRYATAILASQSAFGTGSCSAVIIATGLNYPDALSGAGLGGAANAPVLLVGGDVLRTDVKNEIKRLTQGRASYKVYILGSTAAVTAKMETSIKASLTGESVQRFSGTNRYHTSQLVAAKVKSLLGASFGNKAILVTGLDYVDGLLVGPAAFAAKAPILLVNTTADAGLKSTLKALGTKDLVVLGTAARIPTAVETSLKTAVPGLTTRRASNLTDTYARSAAAAEYFANPANGFGLTWAGLGVATAEKFPDGLGAGCVEGRYRTSLLLTKTASLPTVISAKIAAHDTDIGTVRFYGSTAAVSTTVETAVRNLLP